MLAALAVGLLTGCFGFVLGAGMRPAAEVPPPGSSRNTPVAEAGAVPMAQRPDAPPGDAAQGRLEALRGELASLRAAIAEETSRLAEVTRQRTGAEAATALGQREPPAPGREATPRREPPAVAVARPARPEVTRPEAAPAAGSRVFVHYRAGSAAASEAATAAAAQIRDAGVEVAEMRAVSAAPAQRVVRYFHAEDAAAAARLAGRLGRGWAIQDFRGYEPATAPQTLEIWLPDR